MTTTVTCYSWAPSSGDHLFTYGAIFWPPHSPNPLLIRYLWKIHTPDPFQNDQNSSLSESSPIQVQYIAHLLSETTAISIINTVLCSSVASWAFIPHKCAVFFAALWVADFWASLIKCMRFWAVFSKIFLSKSIVFGNSAEVVRFVFTWSHVMDGFFHSFLFSWSVAILEWKKWEGAPPGQGKSRGAT